MKFGIFYELQCPRPWEADTEQKLYQNALSQVELADKLGYHYAWEVEHHFLEEYSHSPQPEVFLGFLQFPREAAAVNFAPAGGHIGLDVVVAQADEMFVAAAIGLHPALAGGEVVERRERRVDGDQVPTNGRPTAQWSRLKSGRSDDPLS